MGASRAVKTLYRLFLREASRLESQGGVLEARMPIDKMAWQQKGGSHSWEPPAADYSKDALRRLAPWLAEGPDHSGAFTAAELRGAVRRAFRRPPAADADPLDRAFTSLRLLGEQMHMARCSSSCTTDGVRVDVTTSFIGRQSDLDPTYDQDDDDAPPKYYFTYRIRVSNLGESTVQLQSRHFVIRNAAGATVAEVAKGARGVVGCTPRIKPRQCFQYYSGTDMEGPGGSMEGSYAMVAIDAKGQPGRQFEAGIARFQFLLPDS